MSGAPAIADLGQALLYSQCWEDVDVARRALRIRPADTVLAIGAAGDNAIALLQDDPRHVIAIDVNPTQTALIELKAAALRALQPPDLSAFLGAATCEARLARYESLRPALSRVARSHWDRAITAIERGVIHSGRFERYLGWLRRIIFPFAPGRRTVGDMLGARDLADQRRIYETAWDSRRWRLLFRLVASRRFLAGRGRHRAFFEHCVVDDVASHYLERARHALTELPVQTNPFVTYILSGRYGPGTGTPDYLRPELHATLRARIGRLHIETVGLREALEALPSDSIDAFYLSDVFELASAEEHEAMLVEIARVGRPGARLCYWNNLVPRRRPARLAEVILSHGEEAAALHRADRGFLYSALVVESVRRQAGEQ